MTVQHGDWQAVYTPGGNVTLTHPDGTTVRLRYTESDRGRFDLKEVGIQGNGSEPLSRRVYRRIPFADIEQHLEDRGHPGKCPTVTAPGGRVTDEFLKDVAATYMWLADARQAPAPGIAEMTSTPVRTVHRWIYEARKRGILPPARAGRAG